MSAVGRVRDWVGSTPDDTAILAVLGEAGHDPLRAALTILRRRYADMASNPAKWAVVDDYSQDTSENLRVLHGLIGRLETLTGDATDPAGLDTVRIVGPDLNER